MTKDELMDWDTHTPLVYAGVVRADYPDVPGREAYSIRYLFIPHDQTNADVSQASQHRLDAYLEYEPGVWSGPYLTENVRCRCGGTAYAKGVAGKAELTVLTSIKIPRAIFIAAQQFILAQEALNLLGLDINESINESYDEVPEEED